MTVRRCILAVLAASLLSGCGDEDHSAVPPLAASTEPSSPSLPGVGGFRQVSPALYHGAQPTREGFAALRDLGIRTVVSLRTWDNDRPLLRGLGLKYAHISFKPVHPEREDVVAFLKIVADAGNQPVFVHCRHGHDRTGMMVAMYRMVVQDWPREQALAEMKSQGFNEAWIGIEHYVETCDVERLRETLAGAKAVKVELIR
jgi:protein tyrosine phosphatase (PTP) superfamily phosphohydrolase (DUF442 family)